jgi:hypothetical protein
MGTANIVSQGELALSGLLEERYDLPCYFPGCSNRATDGHHVTYGSGSIKVPLCSQHHAEITALNRRATLDILPTAFGFGGSELGFHRRLEIFESWIHQRSQPEAQDLAAALEYLGRKKPG